LSPTWERPLHGRTSGTFARTASSTSSTLRWPTHGAMARWSEQMAWFFKPSKIAFSTMLRSTQPDGTQNCLTSSGVSELRSARSRDTRPSSWSRQFSQPT
jgi:hypothetical protein